MTDFCHDPESAKADYYGSIVLHATNGGFHEPQMWHFAYREIERVQQTTWFPYGVVRLFDNRLGLFNYIGEGETASVSPDSDRVVVQTYLGKGMMEFRVASLHDFDLSLEEEVPSGLPVVGFRYPGPR